MISKKKYKIHNMLKTCHIFSIFILYNQINLKMYSSMTYIAEGSLSMQDNVSLCFHVSFLHCLNPT